MANPLTGDVIQGSGGLRKIRVAAKGKGKRGGSRVIYYYYNRFSRFYLLTIYAALYGKKGNVGFIDNSKESVENFPGGLV